MFFIMAVFYYGCHINSVEVNRRYVFYYDCHITSDITSVMAVILIVVSI